jgi:hypothetical protein
VATFTLAIGEPADQAKVRMLEEPEPVVGREALPGIQFLCDVEQSGCAKAVAHGEHGRPYSVGVA